MVTAAQKKAIFLDQQEQAQINAIEKPPFMDEMMYSGESLSPALQIMYSEMGLSDETVAEVFVSKELGDSKGSSPGVWRGSPDDYNLESIAKTHGSGDYRVRVYITANGHKTKRGEKVYQWLLSPADEAKRLAAPQSAQSESLTRNDIATMVVDILRQTMPVMQQQPPMDVSKMFEMSLAMAKMMQPQQTNTDPLGMMKLFLEMQNSIKTESNGGESKEVGATTNDLILGLIDKFGEPLAQIVMAGRAQEAAQQATVTISQQPQNVEYNPVNTKPINSIESDQEQMRLMQAQQLKMGIAFLVDQAVAGNPFETYAEVAIDFVPAEALDEILAQADPVAWLAVFDHRVGEHKEWFGKMLDEVKKILNDSTEQP
jgi:hypothetical protein